LHTHTYRPDLTALLLLTLFNFKVSGPVEALAFDPAFITGVSVYIAHADPGVRRCGMLVAEVVASQAGKKLNFGDWDGDDAGRVWARAMRRLIEERDADAALVETETIASEQVTLGIASSAAAIDSDDEPIPSSSLNAARTGYDSDDSLTGYASSPDSSRASSPTPSELAEIEKDPTLIVGKKKVPRPVYLAQLGELVRPTTVNREDEEMEADRMEVALDVAEELIRRKRDYGTELGETSGGHAVINAKLMNNIAENAVNLVHGFVGLQDNFELEGFAEKRQAALTALIACCPQKATP
jgi:telomere length regulation protein